MKENHQKYWNINILTSTKICQIIRSNIHWMNAGKMIIKSYYMICILVIHQYHRLYIGYIIGYYNIHNNNKMQPMRQSYDRHWFTHTHNQNMNDVTLSALPREFPYLDLGFIALFWSHFLNLGLMTKIVASPSCNERKKSNFWGKIHP